VTDFIDLPLWPTFNLADVAITVGVLLLLLDVGGSESKRRDR
jgi:lipoprotein signal peptidase